MPACPGQVKSCVGQAKYQNDEIYLPDRASKIMGKICLQILTKVNKLCVKQPKKYTGAAGEFALEMPKRAPEIVQKCAYGGDIKTGNRPRNNFPLPSEKRQGARWIRELASVAGPTSARSLTSRSSALHGMAPYPTEVHQLQS